MMRPSTGKLVVSCKGTNEQIAILDICIDHRLTGHENKKKPSSESFRSNVSQICGLTRFDRRSLLT